MKIRIRKDAREFYIQENTYFGRYSGSDHWERVIGKIAGMILEVDTEYLFKDEFHTLPIEGIAEDGLVIMPEYVEEIIDDARHGKARCELCNDVSDSVKVCTKCGRSDYLDPFFEEDLYE